MPNIFKRLSKANAQPYEFPDAADLLPVREPEPGGLFPDELMEEEAAAEEAVSLESISQEDEPVRYAQVQAESILEDARRRAEEILDEARRQAAAEIERIKAEARDEGRLEGYVHGMDQATAEANRRLEEQAAEQAEAVRQFLDRAGAALDRQMDDSVSDLRDLALAVAEKVVSISLRSSSEVIARMIQTAVDKRKRRDWVHIYIAECDAKRMGQVPSTLMTALSAISDRVRIIPMADDESGTCIIETPDEIVDASASTQLSNIRGLLMDTPSGGGPQNFQIF